MYRKKRLGINYITRNFALAILLESNQSINRLVEVAFIPSRHAAFLRAACVASAGIARCGKLGKLGSTKKN